MSRQIIRSSTQASASVLDCDLILAPVHLLMHWTCVMANLRDHEIVYLDSMGVRRQSPPTCTSAGPTV